MGYETGAPEAGIQRARSRGPSTAVAVLSHNSQFDSFGRGLPIRIGDGCGEVDLRVVGGGAGDRRRTGRKRCFTGSEWKPAAGAWHDG